jgi:hypothetical protein
MPRLFVVRQIVVRQIGGMNTDVVWRGVANEADCLNLRAVLEESFADAMHSIHHAAVARKNDGEGKIAIEYQARMIDDFTAGQDLGAFVGPVGFVQLTNRGERNPLAKQSTGLLDET